MDRWPVSTREELAACYDATIQDVFVYAARLSGDRRRAEDLVSEAYLGLVRASRDGHITSVGIGWLITAVRHRFLDGLRSDARETKRIRLVEPRGGAEPVDDSPPGGADLLAPLSDRERAAVVLRYVDDLSVADVATRLDISVRAAESLLARARTRLRRSEARDA